MAGIAVLDGMQRGLMALPKVKGLIIFQNSTGLPIRSTISGNVAAIITHHILKLLPRARAFLAEIDPYDTLMMMRIRGRNFEYVVITEKEVTMITIQEHTALEVEEGAVSGAMKITTGANEDQVNANLKFSNIHMIHHHGQNTNREPAKRSPDDHVGDKYQLKFGSRK